MGSTMDRKAILEMNRRSFNEKSLPLQSFPMKTNNEANNSNNNTPSKSPNTPTIKISATASSPGESVDDHHHHVLLSPKSQGFSLDVSTSSSSSSSISSNHGHYESTPKLIRSNSIEQIESSNDPKLISVLARELSRSGSGLVDLPSPRSLRLKKRSSSSSSSVDGSVQSSTSANDAGDHTSSSSTMSRKVSDLPTILESQESSTSSSQQTFANHVQNTMQQHDEHKQNQQDNNQEKGEEIRNSEIHQSFLHQRNSSSSSEVQIIQPRLSISSSATARSTSTRSSTESSGKDGLPREARKRISVALKLFSTKQFEEALNELNNAENEFPALKTSGLFYYNRGVAHHHRKEYEQASANFLNALQYLDPTLQDSAFFSLGESLVMLKKIEEAENAYRRAIDVNKNHFDSYNHLADVLRQRGKHEEAASVAEKANIMKPGDVKTARVLLNIYIDMKKFLDAARSACILAGFNIDAIEKGKNGELIKLPWKPEWINSSIDIDNNNFILPTAIPSISEKERVRFRIVLLKAANEIEKATTMKDEKEKMNIMLMYRAAAVRADPCHNALLELHEILVSFNDVEGALRCLRLARRADPKKFWAPFQEGALCYSLERYAEAVSAFKTAATNTENLAVTDIVTNDFFLANALFAIRDYKEANKYFLEAITKGGEEIVRVAQEKLIESLILLENPIYASDALDRLHSLRSNGNLPTEKLVSNYFSEGRVLINLKRYEDAREAFNKVLKLSPSNIEAHRYLDMINKRGHGANGNLNYNDDDNNSVSSASLEQAGPPLQLENVPSLPLDVKLNHLIDGLFSSSNGGNDKVSNHIKEVFIAEGYEKIEYIKKLSLDEFKAMKGMRPGWCKRIWEALNTSFAPELARNVSGVSVTTSPVATRPEKPKLPPRPQLIRNGSLKDSSMQSPSKYETNISSQSSTPESNKKNQALLMNALQAFQPGNLRKVNNDDISKSSDSQTRVEENIDKIRNAVLPGRVSMIDQIKQFQRSSLKQADIEKIEIAKKKDTESKGIMGSLLLRMKERRIFLEDEEEVDSKDSDFD